MTVYLVNEIFESLQGEGTFTGTPAIFVRLQGCPVGCSWCDTKHTWTIERDRAIAGWRMLRKDKDSADYARMGAEEIADTLERFESRLVVLTGGEPALYPLGPLVKAIRARGWLTVVQIETSGTAELRDVPQPHGGIHVTVSPKLDMAGGRALRPRTLARADEIKMPVARSLDVERLVRDVLPHTRYGIPVYLQPVSCDAKATRLCIQAATENGWKVSLQTHKWIGLR